MMELVIKLPEDAYKKLEQKFRNGKANVLDCIILNGIVLPKGHGRLIDADEIQFENTEFDTYGDYSIAFDAIDQADTIIGAEGSENE